MAVAIEIHSKKPAEHGKSFVLIGGFADFREGIEQNTQVINALAQMKVNAEPNSPEDFDFIVTTGDNLRP